MTLEICAGTRMGLKCVAVCTILAKNIYYLCFSMVPAEMKDLPETRLRCVARGMLMVRYYVLHYAFSGKCFLGYRRLCFWRSRKDLNPTGCCIESICDKGKEALLQCGADV
jgi:hypothetical protein